MFQVANSLYGLYNNNYDAHKCSNLVEDLKDKLKNTDVSEEQRVMITERINSIEETSKWNLQSKSWQHLGLNLLEYASGFLGPVAAAVTKLATNSPKKAIEKELKYQKQIVCKAIKVDGRRVYQKKRKRRYNRSANILPNVNSIVEAAKTYTVKTHM